MKSRSFVSLALTALALPRALLASPDSPRPLTPETSLKVRLIQAAEISPDGSAVVVALKSVTLEENSSSTHLFLVPTGEGQVRQLTFSGTSNSEPVWSPDGSRILFTAARDGGPQLHVLDLAGGGEARKVTDMAGGASGGIWSPDGSTIAFVSNVFPDCATNECNRQRLEDREKSKVKARAYDDLLYRHWTEWDEGTRSHIFVMPSDGTSPPIDVTPGKAHAPTDVLNAGRGYAFLGKESIAYAANRDVERAISTNNDLFVVASKGGASKPITVNKALDADPVPSPDGGAIAYVAFARPGFESDRAVLTIWDRKSGKHIPRTDGLDRSVESIAWHPGGGSLFFTAYNRGYLELYSVGAEAGEPSLILSRRAVQNLSVSRRGLLAFVESTFTSPPEVFTYDPVTQKTRQISHFNDAVLKGLKLGKVEELEIDNQGVSVHGFINFPPGFNPSNRYPLVVLIHGGPQGAFVSTWHARWNSQLFAAKDYVVAMPNFRGSTGYGQRFTDLVSGDWGGGAYSDVMAFTDAVVKRGFADERWMCAAGASYGGYLVNWIAGHSQRFRCLISHAGVFNIESMWGDTEELWFPEWELGGTPWSNRETYRRWSPHETIAGAKTPTLVIHGQLDYRVQLSQGQQMFTSLRRLGVPARFVYFPDEGHWITKPQNFVYWYGEMLGWLGRYLR